MRLVSLVVQGLNIHLQREYCHLQPPDHIVTVKGAEALDNDCIGFIKLDSGEL